MTCPLARENQPVHAGPMTGAANEHDWLDARRAFLAAAGFSLKRVPDPLLTIKGGSLVTVVIGDDSWELFLTDEFQDLENCAPELASEVLIRACEMYLDYQNSTDWVRGEALPARVHLPLRLRWADDRKAASEILARLEPITDQVADLEWELNSGRAQALRRFGARRI